MFLKIFRSWLKKYALHILLVLSGCSIFFIGMLSGMIVEKYQKMITAPGMVMASNLVPEIPLIMLEKIENGVLYGQNDGQEVRFVIGPEKEEIVPLDNGAFSFSVVEILPNLSQIPAPAGMQFVASSRGSKYWPLDAPEAAMISVKNRTFFVSAEQAEEREYERGG